MNFSDWKRAENFKYVEKFKVSMKTMKLAFRHSNLSCSHTVILAYRKNKKL